MSQNNPLTAILNDRPFVLLDGAMATELEARGCDLADSLWSAKVLMENPQLIYDVHLDYFCSGAQVAITASYQATPDGFAARGLDETQSRALIIKSVELARQARDAYRAENPAAHGLLIAGSVGRTARTWRMARSTAATTSAARRCSRISTARALKRCWMAVSICWPVRPCRRLMKFVRWRSC